MRLSVEEAAGLVTVQDAGRPGYAHLGVPRAGWLDAPAAELGNRLVGNVAGTAVLELTLASLVVRAGERGAAGGGVWVAVTGAPSDVAVGSAVAPFGEPVWVPTGAQLTVRRPCSGVRAYLAVAGGIDVDPVLGSRSTDTLAWVGPPAVAVGQVLAVGTDRGVPHALDTPRSPVAGSMRLLPGPRADWFELDVIASMCLTAWSVGAASNRVGMRLEGTPLRRGAAYDGRELASEGMVLGAVQVPPSGEPVVFLADHPVTGGYPVAAVVHPDDLWICAQLRPGERVRFRRG